MNKEQALDILNEFNPSITVYALYDEVAEFATALHVLFPDFEFPDFSQRTIKQVLAMYERSLK